MNYKDILKLLDAAPFEPFRIHLTDGKTYEVLHRDFAWLTPTRLMIAVPSRESDRLMEDTHLVGLLHIVRIEPIRVRAAQN